MLVLRHGLSEFDLATCLPVALEGQVGAENATEGEGEDAQGKVGAAEKSQASGAIRVGGDQPEVQPGQLEEEQAPDDQAPEPAGHEELQEGHGDQVVPQTRQ